MTRFEDGWGIDDLALPIGATIDLRIVARHGTGLRTASQMQIIQVQQVHRADAVYADGFD